MGIAIAQNAFDRGAEVTIIFGPGSAKPPIEAKVVLVISTEDMLEAVKKELKETKYQAAILSAAAADYGLFDRKMEKTSSGKEEWNIKLIPLPKVIENVKKIDPDVYLVGFKAEYNLTDDELVQKSYDRMIDVGMDLIVANDVAREKTGFGFDPNEVFIIDPDKNVHHIDLVSKYIVANEILDLVKNHI